MLKTNCYLFSSWFGWVSSLSSAGYYLKLPEHWSGDRNPVDKATLLPTALSEVAQDTSPLSTWAHVPAGFSQRDSKSPRAARKTAPNANISQFLKSLLLSCFFSSCWPTKSHVQFQRHCRRLPKVWLHRGVNKVGTITALVHPAWKGRAELKHMQQMVFLGLIHCVTYSIILMLILAKHNKVMLTTYHPFTRNWKGRIAKLRYWCSTSEKNKNSFLPIQIEYFKSCRDWFLKLVWKQALFEVARSHLLLIKFNYVFPFLLRNISLWNREKGSNFYTVAWFLHLLHYSIIKV